MLHTKEARHEILDAFLHAWRIICYWESVPPIKSEDGETSGPEQAQPLWRNEGDG